MAKTFGAAERRIADYFCKGAEFVFRGERYTVIMSGKPVCSKGEPKTDIYVLARSFAEKDMEFKISYKKGNAEFIENKTTAERAEHFLGSLWKERIVKATHSLSDKFSIRPLIYKNGYRKTEAGSITLGWKFELLRVKSGELSEDMMLTREQVIDVYAGTSLAGDKRDAMVNGKVIPMSGVANYLLFENNNFSSLQSIVNALVDIETYVSQHPKVYFACKALNYRTVPQKYDGDRPLAVYVDWSVQEGKLCSKLCFDTPLLQGGDEAYNKLQKALRQLGVRSTDGLNASNVNDISKIW